MIYDDVTLEDFEAGFERALRECPDAATDARYLIADRDVRIRVVGRELAQEIDLPLVHLQTQPAEGSKPDLTVDFWDAEETGISCAFPESEEELGPYGLNRRSDDGRFVVEERDHQVTWLDLAEGKIVGCVAGTARRCLDERARPFHRQFTIWLKGQGVQSVHCGLIALGDQAVIFAGAGGSGKTTSSISCFRDGFSYLGDDFVGLEAMDDGSFTGHALYASCLVNVVHLKRFPDLEAHARPAHHPHEDKSVIYMAEISRERFLRKANICAVVLPRVVDQEETTFRPATKLESMLTFAPSSVMLLPVVGEKDLDKLAGLVDRVPSYWLELGRDVGRIPRGVEKIFAELGVT